MCWQAAKNKSVNIQIKCTHTFATTSQSNLYLKKKALKQGKSHKKKRIDKLKQKVGQTLHTHKIVKKLTEKMDCLSLTLGQSLRLSQVEKYLFQGNSNLQTTY